MGRLENAPRANMKAEQGRSNHHRSTAKGHNTAQLLSGTATYPLSLLHLDPAITGDSFDTIQTPSGPATG